ncbi:hypothetical protein Tco_0438711 [Tanacetum coccineum]
MLSKRRLKKLLDAGLIYPILNSPWVRPGTLLYLRKEGIDRFTMMSMKLFLLDWSRDALEKMLKRCEDTNLSLTGRRAILCDFAMGLSWAKKKQAFSTYTYASKNYEEAQLITYTEKELLAYSFAKKDLSKNSCGGSILLQEFDIEIRDKKGAEKRISRRSSVQT